MGSTQSVQADPNPAAAAAAAVNAANQGETQGTNTSSSYYQWATDSMWSCGGRIDEAACGFFSSARNRFNSACGAIGDFFASVKTYIFESTLYKPEGTVGDADKARWAMTSSCATQTSQLMAFEKLTQLAAREGEDAAVVNAAIKRAADAFVATNSSAVVALKAKIVADAAEGNVAGRDAADFAATQITEHTNTALVQNAVAALVAADPVAQLAKAEAAIKAINPEEAATTRAALEAYHNVLTVEPTASMTADSLSAKRQAMFFTLPEATQTAVLGRAAPMTAETLTRSAEHRANFADQRFVDAVRAEATAA